MLIRLAYNNTTGTNVVLPVVYDEYCSLVNVLSTDGSEYFAVAAAIAAAEGNGTGDGNASTSATGTGTAPTSTVMSSSAIRGVSMASSVLMVALVLVLPVTYVIF
jgi:hypothetical protein